MVCNRVIPRWSGIRNPDKSFGNLTKCNKEISQTSSQWRWVKVSLNKTAQPNQRLDTSCFSALVLFPWVFFSKKSSSSEQPPTWCSPGLASSHWSFSWVQAAFDMISVQCSHPHLAGTKPTGYLFRDGKTFFWWFFFGFVLNELGLLVL